MSDAGDKASENGGETRRIPPPPSPIRQSKYSSPRLRVLVTGGAGFIGSHLVDRLMEAGHEVIVADNFFTGTKDNIRQWIGHPNFEIIRHDVTETLLVEVDQIYHLACPASPIFYKYNPVKTIKTNVMGTLNMLGLAKRVGARILLTSTSEVYGDPLEHPQKETYWGNVNPIGVRSCYDEGKRVAETLMFDYHRQHGVEIRVARIFNTYGPRMNIDDGRVVSNFIAQAFRNEELTVQAPGTQTRSFCYVADMVDGLIKLMEGPVTGPINLGNPGEFTMLELAAAVKELIEPSASWKIVENTPDDPRQRKPDITKAKEILGWEPKQPETQQAESAASPAVDDGNSSDVDVSKEISKVVKKTATTFAPRASTKSKNPAVPGSTLYTIFEAQAYLSAALGGLLSFNLLFPSDEPDIWRLMGMWSIWMFTIPSLRARDCNENEKTALNYLFLVVPLVNVTLPLVWKSFAAVWTADVIVFTLFYAWKLEWFSKKESDSDS
ncbi:unnamed protein product [Closterium sp. NIES-64]|nr:unnamed protein product [Closterium sp. NIES-64]